jgi:hypothetical protein
VHGKLLGDRAKLGRKVFQFELEIGEIPFHAGKVKALFASLVLLEMQNISAMPKNKIGDGRVEAFLIRTFYQQNRAVLQGSSSNVHPF